MRRADSLRLLALTRPVLAPLAASLVFRLLGFAAGIALLVVAVGGVVGAATEGVAPSALLWTLAGLSVLKGASRYLEQFTGHTVAFKALAILRVHFFRTLEPQAPAATDGRGTGDLLARVTRDVDRVEVFFAHTLVPAVAAVLTPLAVLGWLLTVDVALAVVAAVAFLLTGAVLPQWRARRTSRLAVESRLARGALAQHVTDSTQGVREVLAFGAGERRLAELDTLGARSGGVLRDVATTAAVRRGGGAALVPATLLMLAWVGAGRVADGALGWADVVTVVAAVLGTFPALLAVEEFVADLDQAFASARRLFEITDAVPATSDPDQPVGLPATDGGRSVRFEDVRFAYPARAGRSSHAVPVPEQPALTGVTLDVPAGTTTALVGVSGAGKSTLVAMLLRFWDPDAGRVLLDGVDVRDLTLADLRAHVAVVPQRPYLFAGTLRSNLLVARPDATEADLDRACAQARLTDVVRDLPQGYDTPLGEQGARLSGGQRQRVAIARAFLQDAPVIVLDEATSQLDAATQALVQESLADLARGRTVVQVAHRLETVRGAAQIAVVDGGRILERGTHDELVAAGGAYARLLARDGAVV